MPLLAVTGQQRDCNPMNKNPHLKHIKNVSNETFDAHFWNGSDADQNAHKMKHQNAYFWNESDAALKCFIENVSNMHRRNVSDAFPGNTSLMHIWCGLKCA